MTSIKEYIFIIFILPAILIFSVYIATLLSMPKTKKRKEHNNWIIKILEYATSRESFTFHDICEQNSLTPAQKEQLRVLISEKQILYHNVHSFAARTRQHGGEKENIYTLYASAEDHFRLLEYTELQEARASSRAANRFATAALIVAIISSLYSAHQSTKTLKQPIKIPQKLYDVIERNHETSKKSENHKQESPT